MLAGIKFVDKFAAEKDLEEERKQLKKQKKKQKKEQTKKKHKAKKGNEAQGEAEQSSLDSEPAAPSHAAPASAPAANDSSAAEPAAADKVQREDWMTKSFPKATDPTASSEEQAAQQKASEEKAKAALPTEGLIQGSAKTAGGARQGKVGDGGASWRLKALARAKAQSGDASDPNFGRKSGDIVSEQWGSLSELTAGLQNSRAAHAKAHLLAAKERQNASSDPAEPSGDPGRPDRNNGRLDRYSGGPEGGAEGARHAWGEASHYLQDVKSSRAQMRRPSESSSLSWRRDKPQSRDRDRKSKIAHGRHSTDTAKEDHDRPLSDAADKQRHRHNDAHGTDRHEKKRHSDSTPSDRNDHSRQSRSRDVSNAIDSTSMLIKDEEDRHHAQRHAAARKPVVNPNSKQAELLASVASEMNTFNNDGSFMEQFAAKQAGPPGGGTQGGASPKATAADGAELALSDDEIAHVETGGGLGGNQGVAAALRARLHGDVVPPAAAGGSNKATAAELRARLMRGNQPSLTLGPKQPDSAAVTEAAGVASGAKAQTVHLPGVDSKGRAVAGAFGRALAGDGAPEGGRKPKRVQRFDDGERQHYFADDDRQKLSDLVAQQRYEGAADMDANLADNIVRKGKRFRENELDADAEYDVDGGLDMYESRKKRGTKEQQQKRDRSVQIADHRRSMQALDRCNLCFGSAARQRHLTISLGQTAYLALPAKGRLVPGHSVIVPTEHVASSRQVDEQVWTEIRNFKKCLLQMHMAQGMDVIFIETAMRLGDSRSHAVVDCVPVPPAVAAKAPLYFKKGIDDAESEWSQHHAKRMIDTSGKGLKGSIPANFPYFHVEFNLVKGFVHVIDDEMKFDPQFGRSILIGLLDLPAEDMHRRAKTQSTSLQQQWVADFAKQWDKYDWTKQLS